eukprot:Pgem_evm1s9236
MFVLNNNQINSKQDILHTLLQTEKQTNSNTSSNNDTNNNNIKILNFNKPKPNQKKKVSFNNEVHWQTTYTSEQYDRSKLVIARTPEIQQKISQGIIYYKLYEMESHPKSFKYLDLHNNEKRRCYVRRKLGLVVLETTLNELIQGQMKSGKRISGTQVARIIKLRARFQEQSNKFKRDFEIDDL